MAGERFEYKPGKKCVKLKWWKNALNWNDEEKNALNWNDEKSGKMKWWNKCGKLKG